MALQGMQMDMNRDTNMATVSPHQISESEDHLVKKEQPEVVERDDLFTNLTCGEDQEQDFDANRIKIELLPLLEKYETTSEPLEYSTENNINHTENIPSDFYFENRIEDSEIPAKFSRLSSLSFEAGLEGIWGRQPTIIPDEKLINPSSSISSIPIKQEVADFPVVIKCPICEETFNTRYELTLHERIHTGDKPYKCTLCEKSFIRSGALQIHQKNHSLEKRHGKPSICDQISETSAEASSNLVEVYPESQQSSSFSRNKPHKCTFCGKKFFHLHNAKRHETIIHRWEVQHECLHCEYVFSTANALRIHTKAHDGETVQIHDLEEGTIKEKRHQCSFCENSFTTSRELQDHEKSHTERHKCSICGEEFDTPRAIEMHEITHAEETRLKCKFCGKKFVQTKSLKTHEMLHAEKKRYECLFCDKKFWTSNALKFHERIHTGTAPMHECSFCGMEFSNINNLKPHERTHFDRKNHYPCSFCEKTFGNPENRKHHERVHTGEKPLKCSFCELTFSSPIIRGKHEVIHHRPPLTKSYHCSIL